MPIGEEIAKAFLEPVFTVLGYGTGYVFLTVISFGTIPLAPIDRMNQKKRGKEKWWRIDWSIWLHLSGGRKLLKAECVTLCGFLIWAAAGTAIWLATRSNP